MSGQYTTPPWKLYERSNKIEIASDSCDPGAHNGDVCSIPFYRHGAKRGQTVRYTKPSTADANARLIAAAPELLATLVAVVERIDNNSGTASWNADEVHAIEQLLNRAIGETDRPINQIADRIHTATEARL